MKKSMVLSVSVVGIMLALFAATMNATLSPASPVDQEPTVDYTIPPEIKATDQAMNAQWFSEYDSRTIFDFPVAYLIGKDAVQTDSLVAPQVFEDLAGAVVIHTWDDFVRLNDEQTFTIILVHASMLDQVDKDWMAEAFRNRTLIVGISMRNSQLQDLVDDHCMSANPDYMDYIDDAWAIIKYKVSLAREEYRDTVNQTELNDCIGGKKKINLYKDMGWIKLSHGFTHLGITETTSEDSLNTLIRLLVGETVSYHIPVPDKADSSALPTPVDALNTPGN